jgi:hypothetical protein
MYRIGELVFFKGCRKGKACPCNDRRLPCHGETMTPPIKGVVCHVSKTGTDFGYMYTVTLNNGMRVGLDADAILLSKFEEHKRRLCAE